MRGLLLLAGLLALGTAAHAAGTFVELKAVPSAFIPPVDVTVWLPPGYQRGEGRYAVLYMQDGQNLFDPAKAFGGRPWGADEAVARLPGNGKLRPAIVVGIANLGADRPRQYMPQGVFDRLPPALRRKLEAAYGGKPPFSDAYLRFLATELKPMIDRTYRTDPGREATFVMGSSMGGLISLYALVEYPDVFGGAACLSTHWPLFIPPDGAPPAFEPQVAEAFEDYLASKLPPPTGRRLWFDRGTLTLDAAYGPYQERIDALLASRGWRRGIDFVSRVYVGARHDEGSWRARLADPLTFLLSRDSGGTGPRDNGGGGTIRYRATASEFRYVSAGWGRPCRAGRWRPTPHVAYCVRDGDR